MFHFATWTQQRNALSTMVHAPVHASHSRLAPKTLDLCQWGSGVMAKSAIDKRQTTTAAAVHFYLS
jgi:hypothetical protein